MQILDQPSHRLAVLCGAALLSSACISNETVAFPLEVGFQPLETLSDQALPPAGTETDPHPQGLGNVFPAPGAGHYTSHVRGYLHAPLATVYEALRDPATSYLHNGGGSTHLDGAPMLDVEPFPISFRVRYANSTIIGTVKFEVTYRAGPLEGTEAAPVVIGQRWQKTWGVEDIDVMAGSLVAREVDGAPGVTEVELIAWLKATTQYQSDCDKTVRDLFGNLEAKLASMQP
jgi:hypothetical protein